MTSPAVQVTIDNPRTCAGTTRAGKPCGSQVLCDGTHCYVHSPDREQERAEARRRGGEGRSAARRTVKMLPSDLRPVFSTLATVLDDVLSGATDPKVATAAATVARAMAAIFATGEQEQRMRELEAAIDELRRAAGTGGRGDRSAHGGARTG